MANVNAGTVDTPFSMLIIGTLAIVLLIALFAWPLMGALALFGVTVTYYQSLLILIALRGVGLALGMK